MPAMRLPKLTSMQVQNTRTLIRVGYDVTVDARGRVEDAFRIERSISSIAYCRKKNAKVILLSHRGRPHGKHVHALSLKPVVPLLERLLHTSVAFAPLEFTLIKKRIAALPPKGVLLVENLRYNLGEEKNSPRFAKKLASLGDVFVNDDFSTSHRAHASTVGIPGYVPSCAGFTVLDEVAMLDKVRLHPRHPFVVVIGGGKAVDKLGTALRLLKKTDTVLLGGVGANSMFKAQEVSIGRSKVDPLIPPRVLRVLRQSPKVQLPVDVVVSRRATARIGRVTTLAGVKESEEIFDCGPKTVQLYGDIISSAKTVLWSGTLGLYENPAFAHGTIRLSRRLPTHDAIIVIGGGDTLDALRTTQVRHRHIFLSTGGSAMLLYLSGARLPGIEALRR